MKILLLDIETAPNLVHVWGLYDQNVAINQIQAAGYVLCWAAKWYGDKEVQFDSVHQSKPLRMLKRIHKLVDQADVVVHYNGTKFDMPTLNKEFVLHKLDPPAPYRQVDLLRTARSQFRFPSNKLDYVAQALGLGNKVKHPGHSLWVQCMAKDPEAWEMMETYNKQDVALLEKVYDRLLPWIKNHPNHGVYDEPGIPVCPNCGHHHLQRRGFARTVANKYARYQCMNCGTWSKEPFTEFRRKDRGIIMRATA
jgi:DNA polymerase elongation subunit (family B)